MRPACRQAGVRYQTSMIMVLRKDIETREDIEKMLRSFYNLVLNDDELRFIFIDVAHMNLEAHLPVITDFWETILLDNPVYKKNAMQVHYDLNKKSTSQCSSNAGNPSGIFT